MTQPRRIAALDLSLSNTGVALLTLTPGVYEPTDVTLQLTSLSSKGHNDDTLRQRSLRLRKLAGRVFDAVQGADLVVVEGPSYASQTGKGHDRAGFWWLTVGRLTGIGHEVVEVPPSTLKTYATGKGNAGKDQVLAAVVLRYQHLTAVRSNDEADAAVLAAMAARWIGQPIELDLPQTHQRALRGVRWTPTTN